MKYYIIAGEASGDLHGSNLIKSLKKADPRAYFRGFGGDLMQKEGVELAMHYRDMSFIGIIEVIKNLSSIRRALTFCKEDIKNYHPDAVILVDYPGFNMKVARFAHHEGYKTLYYIAPKIWASRKYRIRAMRKHIDKLFTIFPFEENYFTDLGCETQYLGNPLTDAIAEFQPQEETEFRKANQLSDKPIIALLAGSRRSEIRMCLPEMIKACKDLTDYELVLAGAPSIPTDYYQPFLAGTGLKMISNETYQLLSLATAAVVTSGTATLETALFKVPEVVFYKVGSLTYLIGRPFFTMRFFSLVNIIMNREVVKEFLQYKLAEKIKAEITKLLTDQNYRQSMLENYDELSDKVGSPGTSERVAQSMYEYLTKKV
ncbi:MAG: lipid-A-disaccharide synthase [Bacteroidales bacterium]|nr:lipid-A-disaccharide synthase [Bacteroidales bacterium]